MVFGGTPMEDLNRHLFVFLEMYDTLKLNRVSSDSIRLRLFPFSLRDRAQAWLHSLPLGSITTCDEIPKAFLAKFSPPNEMASLKIKSLCLLKGEMSRSMNLGSDSKTCYCCAHIMHSTD